MRGELELGGGAPYVAARDPASTAERLTRPAHFSAILLLLPAVPMLVEAEGVDVDLPASSIRNDEAGRPFVPLGHAPEVRQRRLEAIDIGTGDGEVEVVVRTRLRSKERVHAPAAMDPPSDVRGVEPTDDLEDIVGGHGREPIVAGVKVDPARHRAQPWRIHALAPDFELLDVWGIPIEADPARGETFDRFFDLAWENGIEAGSAPVRALVWLRSAMGRAFGWERSDLTIPGTRERTLTERLSEEDRRLDQAPEHPSRETAIERLRLVYRFADEALLEFSNATIAGLLHLGWVDAPGGKTAELAVYIKSRGVGSRVYMSLISPFRNWFVYPAWTRHIARLWRDRQATRRAIH